MTRIPFIVALLLAAAVSGCCHPCCAPAQLPPQCSNCGAPGCDRFPAQRLAHWQGKVKSWFHPPRPADVTPPVARFHPVPTRPVFEIPPEGVLP
jgi:hypothetical protein